MRLRDLHPVRDLHPDCAVPHPHTRLPAHTHVCGVARHPRRRRRVADSLPLALCPLQASLQHIPHKGLHRHRAGRPGYPARCGRSRCGRGRCKPGRREQRCRWPGCELLQCRGDGGLCVLLGEQRQDAVGRDAARGGGGPAGGGGLEVGAHCGGAGWRGEGEQADGHADLREGGWRSVCVCVCGGGVWSTCTIKNSDHGGGGRPVVNQLPEGATSPTTSQPTNSDANRSSGCRSCSHVTADLHYGT